MTQSAPPPQHAAPNERAQLLQRIKTAATACALQKPALRDLTQALELHVAPYRLAAFAQHVERLAMDDTTVDLDRLIEPLIDGQRLHLWGLALRFQTRAALVTILEEILVRREYHFRSTSDAPTVIDAGANIGLASYYAKRVCKAGRLICFEPNPKTFEILTANATAGKWNAELHCAALAAQDGKATFTTSEEAPLASALAPRSLHQGDHEITVPTLRLRPFLDEPIGLLKLDIEGAEADVLEDCEGALGQVENIFCEVHPLPGQSPSLLWRVLGVLERAGFMIHVARSPWSERAHRMMPLMQAHRTYSLSVFATRLTKPQSA